MAPLCSCCPALQGLVCRNKMKNDTSFQVEQVEQEEKAVEDSTLGVFGEDWHKWM